MYQMPTTSPINNRKWNLGRFGLVPVQLRGLRGLGLVNDPPTIPVGAQNPTPVWGSATNANITTVDAQQPSQNPLDYVSPQQAVAQGLNPGKVAGAWSAFLTNFASPQDAIAAGVPAGVVNQYWVASPAPIRPPKGAPFWLIVTAGVIAIGAFSMMGRKGAV